MSRQGMSLFSAWLARTHQQQGKTLINDLPLSEDDYYLNREYFSRYNPMSDLEKKVLQIINYQRKHIVVHINPKTGKCNVE